MKQYNRKNFICYLICISLVFSWVTFGISNTSELFSSSSKDDSYTFQVIKDALPATVSTRSESGSSASLARLRNTTNTFSGFGGIFAVFLTSPCYKFFVVLLSLILVNTAIIYSSRTTILNYIHQKDGKK